MKDENRGTVSQSASTGSTAKSEAVYTKNLGESMRVFFWGGINYRIKLQLDRASNLFVCLAELKPVFCEYKKETDQLLIRRGSEIRESP